MNPWIVALLVFLACDFTLLVYVFFKKHGRKKLAQKSLNYIRSHWMRIIDSFDHDPKHAILDADKLLDYALSCHGFQGSVGEKMKKAKSRFNYLDGVWKAHKLRNRIAHEIFELSKSEAKVALKEFKRALNDLGAKL